MPYTLREGRAVLMSEAQLKEAGVLDYLQSHRDELAGREGGRMDGLGWYGYGRVQNIELMKTPKILVPDIADRAAFALDEEGRYTLTSGYGITLKAEVKLSLKYVLGLLNSRLMSLFIKRISTPMRGGFFRYFTQYIEQIPIRTIDFSDKADAARHDKMVALVEQMLKLQSRIAAENNPATRTQLARRIESTDEEIDALVFELYGLSAEEIALVQAS